MLSPRVLIVDDEEIIRGSLRAGLEALGCTVDEASCGREALICYPRGPDLVLLAYRLPDGDGLSILRELRALNNDPLFIIMTACSSVLQAVEAIKEGAFHCIAKTNRIEDIVAMAQEALAITAQRRELRSLRSEHPGALGVARLIGASPAMLSVKTLLQKMALSPTSTVLITGESGTGKDLVARVLHDISQRAEAPFMTITCSVLAETLLESELFGHERGAFTDAKQRKKGLLELADHGTVFLDEVAELSPGLQAKLLRFLEEKTFKRVGGAQDIHVDVRVIAATNRQLQERVRSGQFREDLYYRLLVLPVALPPLRERGHDIVLLAQHYLDIFRHEFHKDVRALGHDALALLLRQSWPGNVRELRNAMERAVLFTDSLILGAGDFTAPAAAQLMAPGAASFALPAEGVDLAALERDMVCQALARVGGNQTRAAALLGMNRDQIRYRIEKFALTADPRSARHNLL